jgi:hypothetical protein
MALNSLWFSGNDRLRLCSSSDAAHVKSGDRGDHVVLIQGALAIVDGLAVDASENATACYGPSTAAAVLAYKTRRNIVNRSYETTPDDIVGRMTIAALDDDIRLREAAQFQLAGAALPFARGLFFAGRATTTVRGVVVTETNSPWFTWAKTFSTTFRSIGADMVTVPNSAHPAVAADRLKQAATLAGTGGFLILSVGHGGHGETNREDEGFFDFAPGGTFRIAGRNAVLPGDPKPQNAQGPTGAKPAQASIFYNFRTPNPILKGGFDESREDHDLANPTPQGAQRLAFWRNYIDVANTFRGIRLSGVILLTCKVGGGTGFLGRLRDQWGTAVIAYRRRVVGTPMPNGRTRISLEGDAPGLGTNTAWGEFLFPIASDMVVVR